MANRYFLNIGTNFNTTANWSTTSGGAGGASVPTSSDVAILDNNSGPLSLEVNINVQGISMTAGYASTFTQNAFTITYGSGNFTVAGGTFVGSNGGHAITGSTISKFIQSGGTFTSTSGTLTFGVAGIGVYSCDITGGVFNHNNGKMLCSGSNHTNMRNLSGYPFWNCEINLCPTCTTGGAIYVDNEMKVVQNNGTTGGSLICQLKGDYIAQNGSVAVTLVGSNVQQFDIQTGTVINQVIINKTGGSVNVVRDFAWNGNWTHTAGVITWNSKKAIARFTNNGLAITNGAFHHLEQNSTSGVSIGTAGNPIQCEGDFILNGQSGVGNFPAVKFKGNLQILTANGNCTGATFNGTTDQTITCNVASYQCPLTVNKVSGTVKLLTNFTMLGATSDVDVPAGTFDQNGFNLVITDTLNITGGAFTQGSGSLDLGRLTLVNGTFNEGPQGVICRGADFRVYPGATFNAHASGGLYANTAVATALNLDTSGFVLNKVNYARLTASLTLLSSLKVATDFIKSSTATTANVIGAGLYVNIGRDYYQNNLYGSRALSTSPLWTMDGQTDQFIFTADGKLDSGNWKVEKNIGKVVLTSHVTVDNGQAGDNTLNNLNIAKGILCTNGFNLTIDGPLSIATVGELRKTTGSTVVSSVTYGTILTVSKCGGTFNLGLLDG